MTTLGSGELEQQLHSLREQQARVAASGKGDGAQARALARDIAAIAAQLGLDEDEAAELAGNVDVDAGRLGLGLRTGYGLSPDPKKLTQHLVEGLRW